MSVFVDTSALFALLDEDDANHSAANTALRNLEGEDLVTHAYVMVEALALTGRRLGWAAVERLVDRILPVVSVLLVDVPVHEAALRAFRDAGTNRVSFVDRTSFAFMLAQRLDTAFAFDADFETAGFALAR
jgi:predicted nucleic acid-binding protein